MSAASKRASVWASRLPLGMTSFNMRSMVPDIRPRIGGASSDATLRCGLAPISSGIEAAVQVRHLDRVEGRLVPLVAGRTPGAVLRLLVVVRREHAEDDRDAGVDAHPEDALLGGCGDEREVVGLAPDHRSDADDGIDGPADGEPARGAGQLEGT